MRSNVPKFQSFSRLAVTLVYALVLGYGSEALAALDPRQSRCRLNTAIAQVTLPGLVFGERDFEHLEGMAISQGGEHWLLAASRLSSSEKAQTYLHLLGHLELQHLSVVSDPGISLLATEEIFEEDELRIWLDVTDRSNLTPEQRRQEEEVDAWVLDVLEDVETSRDTLPMTDLYELAGERL